MRADRLLSILSHLQVQRRITARELAGRLEVSERTIHRDMEALGAAGIPVMAERGLGGGWSLLESYQTNLTSLNAAEIQSLFLTKPALPLADLGLAQAADGALVKLLAALPAMQRRSAEYIRQRIHIDTGGWHRSEEAVPLLPALQEAIWQERQLALTYGREDGAVERLVDPLGLVAKGSIWYLVAGVAGAIRTYRVSRIQAARVTATPCARPADFDLAAHWQQAAAAFIAQLPQYPTVLRVAPSALPRLRVARYARLGVAGPPDAEGWVRIDVQFETPHEAGEYVLGLGAQVEVLEPPELREAVIRQAAAVVAFYARQS
jgi:predicted DNA-binding transcriptional regulator YafY